MSARLRNLDVARGLAILGILTGNVISFALPAPAYVQFDLSGADTLLDRVVGLAILIPTDEWPLGLVAMLFGIGVALFVRSPRSAPAPRLRAIWRGALLLCIGLGHRLLWEGDVLTVYGACMPLLVLATLLPPRWVTAAGATFLAASVAYGMSVQAMVNEAVVPGFAWFLIPAEDPAGQAMRLTFLLDVDGRALGLGLVGVGIAGTRFLAGALDDAAYRRIAIVGLSVGGALTSIGQLWPMLATDPQRVVFIADWLGNAASVPMAAGILAATIRWSRRTSDDRSSGLRDRLEAVGRTALSTYLVQTVVGITLFRGILAFGTVGRAGLAVFCLAMWAFALVVSPWWLARFRHGPVEWVWRVCTYLRLEPFRVEGPLTRSR